MLERTTMVQTDAVERPLTLVEKLEQVKEKQKANFNKTGDKDYAAAVGSTQNCINIVKQHSQETCNWRNNKGTGLWECHYGGDYTSDCGLEWNMSNKDSPNENEMHFCPKCGKKLVEVQPPSEVQDD